jgi:hypothetical protein
LTRLIEGLQTELLKKTSTQSAATAATTTSTTTTGEVQKKKRKNVEKIGEETNLKGKKRKVSSQ